jgi:hypothetical protein
MPNTVNYNPHVDVWGNDDDTFNVQSEGESTSTEVTAETEQVSAAESATTEDQPLEVNGINLDNLETEESPPEVVKPEEKPLGYDQFALDFKKHIGVDLEGAKAMLAELQAFRVETLIEKQQSVLKGKWGDSYDDRFTQVKEYFQKLSPAKQQALDNPEGAELIWAKISSEQSKTQESQTPTNTNRATTGNKQVLQYSDILAMTPKEYKAKQKEIQLAFDEGRVNMDDGNEPF